MQIIGHQNIWKFLVKSKKAEKISHAYLFSGPSEVGKKTVALEFVKLLNCENNNGREIPCQKCRACKDIEKLSYPDLIFIKPSKKEIYISQIRELIWKLALEPYSGRYKVAIIDDAHLMNKEAQSALLKTLEEPKGKSVIILITAFPELLLPTIISRVEKLRFSLVPKKEIMGYLIRKNISEKLLKELVDFSIGKVGEVIYLLEQQREREEIFKKQKELDRLMESSLEERFRYAKEKSQDFDKLKMILEIWLRYFRNQLISSLNNQPTKKSLKKLKKIINLIQDIHFLLSKTEVNKKLALETLLLEF